MKFTPFLFLILSCSFAGAAFGQDLTGIWRGHFSQKNSMYRLLEVDDRYKFEVQIDQHDKLFQGVTYSYRTTEFYGKAVANGTINPKTQKVKLDELKIVEVRMSTGADACIMTCFLQYSKSEAEEIMEGTYVSMNIRDSSNCGKGTVFLRKVPTSDFYKEPFIVKREKETDHSRKPGTIKPDAVAAKKPTPPVTKPGTRKSSLPKPPAQPPIVKNTRPLTPAPPIAKHNSNSYPPEKQLLPRSIAGIDESDKNQKPEVVRKGEAVMVPLVLRNRQNELVRTIPTQAGDITINLYDNGTIDNDTISVYLDKKLVVNKQRLSLDPIVVHVHVDDASNYHELVMVAENLGDIPPNTSLMVVKAGDKQYEVNITSTEQKNAMVIFKLDKPKAMQ